jgi:hypothetical protein
VSAAGLTVKEQALGAATSFKYFDVKPLPYADQGNGIIGFIGSKSSSFHPPARSWVRISTCASKRSVELDFDDC